MASSMEPGGFMLVSSKHVAVSCQRVAVSQNTAWFSRFPAARLRLAHVIGAVRQTSRRAAKQEPCTHETSPLPAKQSAYRGKSAERHPEQEFEKKRIYARQSAHDRRRPIGFDP